jgi:D-alanyl-D-alanine carboxypeptidase
MHCLGACDADAVQRIQRRPPMKSSVARLTVVASVLGILVSLLSGCADDGSAAERSSPVARELQAAIDQATLEGIPGVALYVKTPDFTFDGVSGVADSETGAPLRRDHRFRIGSCSKTYVATLATILSLRGRLDLERPISGYLPADVATRLANADRVTVRNVLNHTSGLFDYLNDGSDFIERAIEVVQADPDYRFSDREAVEYAFDKPAWFEPGTQYRYSNTNYLVLGLILDRILGRHHSHELSALVLRPLDLNATQYSFQAGYEPGRLAHGYTDYEGEIVDATHLDLGNGTTDGGIVATASDMGRFIGALLTRQSFPTLGEHTRFLRRLLPQRPGGDSVNADTYGLGICGVDSPLGLAYGHDGHTFGYGAMMFYFPEVRVSVGLLVNSDREETQPALDALATRIFDLLARDCGREGYPRREPGHTGQMPGFAPGEAGGRARLRLP